MKAKTITIMIAFCLVTAFLAGCNEQACVKSSAEAALTCPKAEPVKPICTKTEPVKPVCTKAKPAVKSCPSIKAAQEGSKLVVIANETNYKLCEAVVKFIETRGVAIQAVEAAKADKYKKAKYVMLLAGVNESDATGEMAKQLLSQDEQSWTSQPGNKKMYLKANKWADGQYILVFAGMDSSAVYRAFVAEKERWWPYIRNWFNIEPTHEEVYGY